MRRLPRLRHTRWLTRPGFRRWVGMGVILLVCAASIAWRTGNLGAFSLSNDEGAYLMWAWLVHSGYALYSQTASVSAPAFIVFLDWAFSLAGVSLTTGRALVLGFTGATLVTLAWLAGRLQANLTPPGESGLSFVAGLAAVVAFSLAPTAFSLSRMAMGELPAVTLASLSLALALAHAGTPRAEGQPGRRLAGVWLALSGMAFSLSLLVKALNPLVVLPVGAALASRHIGHKGAGRSIAIALGAWVLAALVPLGACLLAYDPAALVDQAVAFRLELRQVFPWQVSQNLVWLRYFVEQQWGGVALGLAGLVLLSIPAAGQPGTAGRRGHVLAIVCLWLVGAAVTVLTHSPLFPHHTVILLPPLAVLAGLAVGETGLALRERRWARSGIGLLAGLAFVLGAPAALRADQEVLAASFGRENDAIEFLQKVTWPGDYVVSDNLLLAFMAGRQTPPALGDVAQVAINSGRQTSQHLIAVSESYPVEAVADWALRLPYLAGYMDWVRQNYLVRRVWDDHHIIYFGRKVAEDAVPNAHRVPFQDGVVLAGFDASWPGTRPASGGLLVTLFWSAWQPPGRDYTVFVHLYDAAGQLAASHDGPPLFGYWPTSQWRGSEIVPDRHAIQLPQGLAPGPYRLVVGLYDPASGRRLPVLDRAGTPAGDEVELEQISYQAVN